MKRTVLIVLVAVVIAYALKVLIPKLVTRQKTKTEEGRDELIAGIADVANALRIPVLAQEGRRPMQTMNVNPIYDNPLVYGMKGATRNPKDTGNVAGSISGAQKTSVAGNGWRSWLGFNP